MMSYYLLLETGEGYNKPTTTTVLQMYSSVLERVELADNCLKSGTISLHPVVMIDSVLLSLTDSSRYTIIITY